MDDLSDFWETIHTGRDYRRELKDLQTAQRRAIRKRARNFREMRDGLEDLRGQLEFVTLILGALLAHVEHTGGISREELRELMIAADGFDGKLDGRMPVAVLQELLRPPVLEELFDDEAPAVEPDPGDATPPVSG